MTEGEGRPDFATKQKCNVQTIAKVRSLATRCERCSPGPVMLGSEAAAARAGRRTLGPSRGRVAMLTAPPARAQEKSYLCQIDGGVDVKTGSTTRNYVTTSPLSHACSAHRTQPNELP